MDQRNTSAKENKYEVIILKLLAEVYKFHFGSNTLATGIFVTGDRGAKDGIHNPSYP